MLATSHDYWSILRKFVCYGKRRMGLFTVRKVLADPMRPCESPEFLY